jgi:hypothetical protein
MAQHFEHLVLIGGLHSETRSRDLWRAIEDAGLLPSALGCPTDMLKQGFSYAVFGDRAGADAAAALNGVLRLDGRVLSLRVQADRRRLPPAALAHDSSDEERPPRPSTPPPEGPPDPAAAAGALAQAPGIPRALDLGAALGPFLLPHTDARRDLVVRRVHHLRFHEEYYGVYLQAAYLGTIFEGHVTLLHCRGCAQRLTPEQVRKVGERCLPLRERAVELAHVPMSLVMWRGRLHRGLCIVHVHSSLSRALWGIRGLLSSWIPAATSGENRKEFHLSFDRVAVA